MTDILDSSAPHQFDGVCVSHIRTTDQSLSWFLFNEALSSNMAVMALYHLISVFNPPLIPLSSSILIVHFRHFFILNPAVQQQPWRGHESTEHLHFCWIYVFNLTHDYLPSEHQGPAN